MQNRIANERNPVVKETLQGNLRTLQQQLGNEWKMNFDFFLSSRNKVKRNTTNHFFFVCLFLLFEKIDQFVCLQMHKV